MRVQRYLYLLTLIAWLRLMVTLGMLVEPATFAALEAHDRHCAAC